MIYSVYFAGTAWEGGGTVPFAGYWANYLPLPKPTLDFIRTAGGLRLQFGEGNTAEKIKASEDDSFLFLLSDRSGSDQSRQFDIWVKANGLEKYITYRTPYKITNPGHSEHGRVLTLVVMQSENHFQKELIK